MSSRILVVEDEILVALELEFIAAELGHEVVGIAPDCESAMALAPQAEIALVDLNLRDGETGAEIGSKLARDFGVTVVFMTANPSRLGRGVPGTLGVIPKPCSEQATAAVINFADCRRAGLANDFSPPGLRLFAV